ncbi:disease resistance-like protein DSC1 [Neltuma alba]|uniref:disease resistance-like protein DSC1 n=1 Tax=Neltuma alba TaxID=207710 RepID=UPI0010A540E0|nr:disease resistance-like protein DSC1 [Prosopis alba]
MGSLGKTTLARALYNKWCSEYNGSHHFVEKVGEKSKNHGIQAVKKDLIKALLGDNNSHTSSYDMRRLRRKEVFIVFDDVNNYDQVNNLVGRKDRPAPDPKLRGLAKKLTRYANGNPLALKVLGSSLANEKDQEAWESRLEKLRKSADLEINEVLKISLEGLDIEARESFLDIACVLTGDDTEGRVLTRDVEVVKNLLKARRGYSTVFDLNRLRDAALLEVDEFGRILMHDLLKEMGRQVVREESKDPRKRSRLWDPKDISEILENERGSEAIEGVSLNLPEVGEMCLSPGAFRSMPNLKILNFYFFLLFDGEGEVDGGDEFNVQIPDGIDFLPEGLMQLLWKACPLESLPAPFRAENLVQLDMSNSRLTRLWDGVQNLPNLIEITLARSEDLIELPDFSKAVLNILTSDTPLQSLLRLYAGGCSSLEKFSVTSESEDFYLDLSGTAISGALRSSSGHRGKIRSLSLNNCRNVTSVHKLIKLRDLRRLEAGGCNELALSLLSKCYNLEFLWLADCNELSELPNDIRMPSSLRELVLSRTHVQTLPSSIKHLSRLQRLRLDGCKRLRCLPELPPSILTLIAANCISLETIQYSPLTNEGEEGKDKACPCFIFTNCKKLNRRAIKAAEARVLLEIKKATHDYAGLEYPGKRVPKWFMYKDKGSSVSVNLSSIPNSEHGRFLFCVVVSELPWGIEEIDAKWFVDGKYACRGAKSSFSVFERTSSKHVCLWYDPDSFGKLKRKIGEKKRNGQSNMDLQVKFKVRWDDDRRVEIKRCGVCPISAVEYQDGEIKQIPLPLPPQPSSNANGSGLSKTQIYENL